MKQRLKFKVTIEKEFIKLQPKSVLTERRLDLSSISMAYNNTSSKIPSLALALVSKSDEIKEESLIKKIIRAFEAKGDNEEMFIKFDSGNYILSTEEFADVTNEKIVKWISDFMDAIQDNISIDQESISKIYDALKEDGLKVDNSNQPSASASRFSMFSSLSASADAFLGDDDALDNKVLSQK